MQNPAPLFLALAAAAGIATAVSAQRPPFPRPAQPAADLLSEADLVTLVAL